MFDNTNREAMVALFAKKMGMEKGVERNSSTPFDIPAPLNEEMLVSTITVPSAPTTFESSEGLEDTSRFEDTKPDLKLEDTSLEDTKHNYCPQYDADLRARVLTAEAYKAAKIAKEARIAARILEMGGDSMYKQNMQDINTYWERFFSVRTSVNGLRYQFMFPDEIVPTSWDNIRALHVPNQWLSVQKHVATNPVLAQLIKHMGLREFKTLLTGHSFALIVRRLQRIMSQTLMTLEVTKFEDTKAEDTCPEVSDLMNIIKEQRDDIRSLKLKLRINTPVTPYSDAKAVVDWVNDIDSELALLEDTKHKKQVTSRHDAERDAIIASMRNEGKTQREIAHALNIQQKSVARACKRMGV